MNGIVKSRWFAVLCTSSLVLLLLFSSQKILQHISSGVAAAQGIPQEQSASVSIPDGLQGVLQDDVTSPNITESSLPLPVDVPLSCSVPLVLHGSIITGTSQ